MAHVRWLAAFAALAALAALPGVQALGCAFDLDEVKPAPGAGSGGAGGAPTTGSDAANAGPVTSGPGSGGGGGVGGAGGAGGAPPQATGCADGTREAFKDEVPFPYIAACSGGFSVPGLTSSASMSPACNRQGGNTGPNPAGAGCSVADLCAVGWHVCTSSQEVADHGPGCPTDLAAGDFFATRQAQNSTVCAPPPVHNNVVGCGDPNTFPDAPDPGDGCGPLDRMIKNDPCDGVLTPWACHNDAQNEAAVVTKEGAERGGVLCCKDTIP
jgi:hypothetical protein